MSTQMSQKKITVTLPASLLSRLDARVASRQRSDFIAHAVEEQLAILEQALALEESAGAWQGESYAGLDADEGIERWLADLRGPADERHTRLFGEAPDVEP